ncbi:hypothetical protein CLAFUW4_03375 [Fulvia fulva]|uniref:Uncharacterized protein n=1 Tax=Passalora fulva TaxID=5499 RepID=A0A9Q8LBY2_PASFU|nr:uncharacterized protein CLAFUR5_03355 [Fulvia fulva]KAK4631171.1 hypothetical protein CLAFUR4_03364 [Fulvia fulva]KAK4633930.1 hypothetical protein CLAFUR0_03369 [Fulvia fulva]UJO14598.1 hypothetical protein CLAFUR5_03355 [Fulvia fulva]WPV10540.1 hypothetical protein CLAFUW4_03375 [Fulvia fulva]WPV26874.1 hypothetical protein CLAFUW7_03367 [Fulvia fulva]
MGGAASKPHGRQALDLQTILGHPQPKPRKSIRLLDLPPELRLIIYSHYLATQIDSINYNHTRPPLLSVCRLIREEAICQYKKLLLTLWNDNCGSIRQTLRMYPHFQDYNLKAVMYYAIRHDIEMAASLGMWFLQELRMMEREGQLWGGDQCLGCRVKLELLELRMAFYRLPILVGEDG